MRKHPNRILLLTALLALSLVLGACSRTGGGDPAMQAVTTAPTAPAASTDSTTVPETTSDHSFVPNITEEVTGETVPMIPVATDGGAASDPTEDPEIFDPSLPEDTRPPIEVTLPDETVPYTDFETYNNMTEEEQKAFYDSFEDPADFFDWYNAAKAEYEKTHPPIIIDGSTNIEIKP